MAEDTLSSISSFSGIVVLHQCLCLKPFKVLFSGTDLEMAFCDAEVDGGVAVEKGETGAGLHLVAVVEDEHELLLIDSRGC